jgi:hypothetical protein
VRQLWTACAPLRAPRGPRRPRRPGRHVGPLATAGALGSWTRSWQNGALRVGPTGRRASTWWWARAPRLKRAALDVLAGLEGAFQAGPERVSYPLAESLGPRVLGSSGQWVVCSVGLRMDGLFRG